MNPLGAPPPGEHRYQLLERLGQGGMGEVWKARDRALDRRVALKFLRGGDPDREGRLLLEAQRQARVSHPGICMVFEAGVMGDRAFIAMELIPGPSLGDLSPPPGPREAAEILAHAAEGVHAAHMAGLVHRDLKPGNILLRPLPEGGWRPVVADFGLARDVDQGSLSDSGPSLGTPAFMAPEQILGDRPADARSDVYALGATLYCLLAGHPAHTAPTEEWDSLHAPHALEVFRRVLEAAPPSLRKANPSVPRPLETIVATCMEPEPERRYPSARALAEDLGRFLDGAPILARRPGVLRRLRGWAHRHRALAAASGVALAALVGVGAVAFHLGRRSRVQAALAQRLGQALAEQDHRLRLVHLSPRHDIRAQVAEIRKRLEALRIEVGHPHQAPAAFALGQAHLLLGEWDEARRELDRAWDMGFRDPECAQARGLALLRLYQRGLDAQWQVPAEEREEYRAHLDRELRDAAKALMTEARGPYQEAQWAWLEGREEEALRLAARALQQEPWAYEAWMLQHRIWRHRHREARRHGDGARRAVALGPAEEALSRALAMAHSDPAVLAEEALWIMEKARPGLESKVGATACLAARSACDRALEADPEYGPAWLIRAETQARSSLLLPEGSPEARRYRDAAIEDARRAGRLHPRRPEALGYLALQVLRRARYAFKTGAEALPDLEEAIAACTEAIRLDPAGSNALSSLGSTRRFQAEVARAQGMDPRPYLKESVAAERRLLERHPEDPRRARSLAQALVNLAWGEFDAGGDAATPSSEARAVIQGRQAKGELSPLRIELELFEAEKALAGGRDAAEPLEAARALLGREVPEDHRFLVVEFECLAARAAHAAGRDPGPALARAQSGLVRYRQGRHRPTTLLRLEAEVALTQVRTHGASTKEVAQEGLRAARALLALRPMEHRARALEGLFLAQGAAPAAGQAILRSALAKDPRLVREFGSFLSKEGR